MAYKTREIDKIHFNTKHLTFIIKIAFGCKIKVTPALSTTLLQK